MFGTLYAVEYHVSQEGNDANEGTASKPLRTISAGARRARAGDVITVHHGVYRERINPPRGGTSDDKRIVYQAAPVEKVVIKGSEVVKGWIIEDNEVSYSVCSGITLGKYGDEFDNKAGTAKGYVGTVERALARGWSKENIGSHTVRNNHVHDCEQAGIVGSLGAAFSTISGNDIHDIHIRKLFTGAEMSGIKIHGPIDAVISHNHVYRCYKGIWLDWMTQGARVTRNLLHDNSWRDLDMEVNHGPFLIDHNLFLSTGSGEGPIRDMSQGGAYVHNLFAGGNIFFWPRGIRSVPYFDAHSTKLKGLKKLSGGDNRFLNNIFVGGNALAPYDEAKLPVWMAGNVFVNGARPSTHEREALVVADFDPGTKLQEKPDGWWLEMAVDPAWISKQKRAVVTTESLGKAKVPDAPFEKPDGTAYRLDTDYFGKKRNTENPTPGSFRFSSEKVIRIKVWPRK